MIYKDSKTLLEVRSCSALRPARSAAVMVSGGMNLLQIVLKACGTNKR